MCGYLVLAGSCFDPHVEISKTSCFKSTKKKSGPLFISQISTETFERARVLIAPANKAKGNQPYTQQPGACGDEGDFIHFTPEWLLDTEISSEFGPQGTGYTQWLHSAMVT